MKYIKVINEQNHIYPYSDRQFRRDNANVSFPSTISDEIKSSYQVYPVIEESSPMYNEATQRIVRQQPQLINNQWVVKWEIVDKTEEERLQYREGQIRKVKAEANRRIVDIAPEWRQRNMTARGVELLSIGRDAWTPEQRDEHLYLEAIWEEVKKIRAKSDDIEEMDSIPEDFKDDKYWI
jgi:hypothetical protein